MFIVLQMGTSAMHFEVEGVEPGGDITRQCVIAKERDRAHHAVIVARLLTSSDDRRRVSDAVYDVARDLHVTDALSQDVALRVE